MKNGCLHPGIVLSIFLSFVAAATDLPFPQDFGPPYRIQWIYLEGNRSAHGFDTRVAPFNTVSVARFTRVNFVNNSPVDVNMTFGRGTNCQGLSQAGFRGLGWRLSQGCYQTAEPLRPGGILEIRMDEPGSYEYEADYLGEKKRETGKINVL